MSRIEVHNRKFSSLHFMNYKNEFNIVLCRFMPWNHLHFVHCTYTSDVRIVSVAFNLRNSGNSFNRVQRWTPNIDNVARDVVEWIWFSVRVSKFFFLLLVQILEHNSGTFTRIRPSAFFNSRRIFRWGFPTYSLARTKTRTGLHIKCIILLSDLIQNWNMSTNCSGTPKCKM